MSTVQRVNFEPQSSILPLHLRDFPLADATLVQPLNANALVDGEWVTFEPSAGSTQGMLRRVTAIGSAGQVATRISFPAWAERGRYDIQYFAGRKYPIIFLGQYEFDTRIFDASVDSSGAGVPITEVGQPIKVATITLGTRNYCGLIGSHYDDVDPIVGYVTRLPAANGGKLRFMSGWAIRNGTT